MRYLFVGIIMSLLCFSCGDPSKDPGKDAAQEQNQHSGEPANSSDHSLQADTSKDSGARVQGSGADPANGK